MRRLVNCEMDKDDISLIVNSLNKLIENENDLYLIDKMEDLIKYLIIKMN